MAKVVTAITARVEVIGKLKNGQFGEYRPVLFIDLSKPEGAEEAKIWKNLSVEECAPLHKGQSVQLVPVGQDQNGNLKHNILLMESPAAPQASSADSQLSADRKREIAAYVTQMADLLKFCRDTAVAKLGSDVGEETIRATTSSLFISCQRKFHL